MGAIASIVLPDATPVTPVNHTFAPSSVKGDQGSWANQASSLPIGFETITMSLIDPAGKSSVYRVPVGLRLPVLKTTTDMGGNSTTTVDYWLEFTGEFKMPARSTLQNRQDLVKLTQGLLADSQFTALAEGLSHVF